VLRHFTQVRNGTPMLPSRYAALHRELLAAAERYEQRLGPHLRPDLRTLRDLARPWISQASLAAADRSLLISLTRQARRAERRVFGRLAVYTAMKVVAYLILAAALGAIVLRVADQWYEPSASGSFIDVLRIELKRGIWRIIAQDSPYRRFVACLILIVVGSWWSTSARKY
jgi:hypothetical protein